MGLLKSSIGNGWAISIATLSGLVASAFMAWTLDLANSSTVWAAIGSVGSLAAAGAAAYAAVQAIRAARLPIEAAEERGHMKAKVLAGAIAEEIDEACVDAFFLAEKLQGVMYRDVRNEFIPKALEHQFGNVSMIERFVTDADFFGVEHGKVIASACAAVLNINGQLRSMSGWSFNPSINQAFDRDQLDALRRLASYAEHAHKQCAKAKNVLRDYGVKFVSDMKSPGDSSESEPDKVAKTE